MADGRNFKNRYFSATVQAIVTVWQDDG